MKDNRLKSALVISLILIAGTLFMRLSPWRLFFPTSHDFASLREIVDNYSYDLAMRMMVKKPKVTDDIVIIYVTQDCLDYYRKNFDTGWPWPRLRVIDIIEFCETGGAKAIFFDFMFTDPSPWNGGIQDDSTFAKALNPEKSELAKRLREKNIGIFFPGEFEDAKRTIDPPSQEEMSRFFSIDASFDRASTKPKKTAWLKIHRFGKVIPSLVDIRSERGLDGIFRGYTLFSEYNDSENSSKFYPSPAMAIILHLEGTNGIRVENGILTAGKKKIPVDEKCAINLKYYGKFGTYKQLTAASVIQAIGAVREKKKPEIDPSVVKDKIVLVGVNFPGVGDLKLTPVDSNFPGVEIHATALANILADDYIIRLSDEPVLAFSIFYLLVCPFVFRLVKPRLVKYTFYGIVGFHAVITVICFQNNFWDWFAPQFFAILTSYVSSIAAFYIYEGRQKALYRKTFQSYVSPAVVNKIMSRLDERKKILTVDGERKELTVMFLDFVSFTEAAEKMRAEDVVATLREYFRTIGNEIFKTEGTIDKYIGDSVMAFWGDPIEQQDHALRACKTAVGIKKALGSLTTPTGVKMKSCIGINSGQMVVGDTGYETMRNYSVIGDEVNLASRIEGANRYFGTRVLITETTFEMSKEAIVCREIGLVTVKGKVKPIRIYELFDLKNEIAPEEKEFVDKYTQGLQLFRSQQYQLALEAFSSLAEKNPDDTTTLLYKDLCANPPKDGPTHEGEHVHQLFKKW